MPGVWSGVRVVGYQLLPSGVPQVRKHQGRQAAFDRRRAVARRGDKRPRPVVIRSLWYSLRLPPAWLALARLCRSYDRCEGNRTKHHFTLPHWPVVRKHEKLTLIFATAYTANRPQAA